MTWRQRKKLFYGLIFVGFVVIVVSLVFLALRGAPSCYDRRQNQGEQGVDCGGPCLACEILKLRPLKIYPVKSLLYPDGSLDLLAEVENPNLDYGVVFFEYKFIIQGEDRQVAEVSGESYILPQERKFILSLNREVPTAPISAVALKINFPPGNWQKSPEGQEGRVAIELLNSEFQTDSETGQPRALKAELINAGNRDYENIGAHFVLLDEGDQVMAAVSTQIERLEPLQRQTVQLALPPLTQIPAKVIFQAESNIFK